ncbi:hypothetical protein [Micromonospora sp. WMMC273]|uniref:hypothetical protein n=1 Tax=Micromonospora sp. WMMC273 TaxID=3015157 RepID=UPI0022B5F2C6|nr:hypothetical protein [Micromonospora sp. WMMC273]MCZ7478883.1 hypothetical protein [Micromonospora sp. WMMC273]
MTSTNTSSGGRRRPSTDTTTEAFTGQDSPQEAAKVDARDADRQAAREGTVLVEVVVSHGHARRGERGEVELTDAVRARLDRGYLRRVDPATVPVSRAPGTAGRPAEVGLAGGAVPPAAADAA